jgi:mono/diheme cytochrome c family protein
VIDTTNGDSEVILRRDSIAHMQFCPDDSNLIFYAGPVHDRVWLINRDGSNNHQLYKRDVEKNEWITHETMINSVKRRAPDVALPKEVSVAQAIRGFCAYETHCVACHGAAAVARAQWVNGLNPEPPYLLDATKRWSPSQLHWIVRNGIKMTGMPAWRESMTDRQIRDVVAFVEAMPQMPPQTYVRWRAAKVCAAGR